MTVVSANSSQLVGQNLDGKVIGVKDLSQIMLRQPIIGGKDQFS